jgi:hypothetical protein
MYDEVDPKGKKFTNVITKIGLPVVIQTLAHRIEGSIHIQPQHRLMDELNNADQFLAITDARVVNLKAEVLFQTKFMTVNKHEIIWILPTDEIQNG